MARPVSRLTTTRALHAAAQTLAEREPRFAFALSVSEPISMRQRDDGFQSLLRAIVSQQLSVAAARTIEARLDAANLNTPTAILKSDDAQLRALGLSRQKIGYLRALANANIDYRALRKSDTDAVIATLTRVSGIGRWTAEIYAMFALGHADAFAAGDLALQESARLLFALPERPKEAALRARAQAWSPYRAVAARILWAYYRVAQTRDGVS